MKRSLRDGGGYLEIDHRFSPGLSPQDVAHVPGAVAVEGGQRYETDVYQCSHCERTIVLRAPSEKMATRGYCQKCDHWVCNSCEAIRVKTGECVPFKMVLDRARTVAEKYSGQPDHPDATTSLEQLRTPREPMIVLTDGND